MSRGSCKDLGDFQGKRKIEVIFPETSAEVFLFPDPRFQQIMHYHMQHEQYRQVIAVCERHGEQDPSLWEQALSYFARKEEDCKEYVAAVLKHIENKNLMPPLLGTGEDRLLRDGLFSAHAAWFFILFLPVLQSQWYRPWPTTPQLPCPSSETTWSKNCRNRASRLHKMSCG